MNREQIGIFKALSDETRMHIVSFLAGRQGSSCGDISVHFQDLSQPTLSHHFKVLVEAGIITVEKRSVSRYYRLNKKYLRDHGVNPDKIKEAS